MHPYEQTATCRREPIVDVRHNRINALQHAIKEQQEIIACARRSIGRIATEIDSLKADMAH